MWKSSKTGMEMRGSVKVKEDGWEMKGSVKVKEDGGR